MAAAVARCRLLCDLETRVQAQRMQFPDVCAKYFRNILAIKCVSFGFCTM
jgi:hypothetical protein